MQTVEYKDVVKSATEVTSLASTDRVMVCDANGVTKRMTQSRFVNQDCAISDYQVAGGESRWIRIARMKDYGSSAIISVSFTGFSVGWCCPITMMVYAPHGDSLNVMSVSIMSPKISIPSNSFFPFSKVRITGNEATKYIDILVPQSTSTKKLSVTLAAQVKTVVVSPIENPELMNSVKEFSLSNLLNSGG